MADFRFQFKDDDIQAIKGSHFQFKSEKEWRSTGRPLNNRFTLNMKTLAEDLSTIPFYERQNLPLDLFCAQNLNEMERNFTKLENNHLEKPERKSHTPTTDEVPGEKICASSNSANPVPRQDKGSNESPKNEECSENKAEDLEDWLDSVLDD